MPYIKFIDLSDPKMLSKVPEAPGIYRVLSSETLDEKQFQDTEFKNPKHNVCAAEAFAKYNKTKNKEVLYIGKAENLNKRLSQFVRFGCQHCSNHKGGRFIFAIKGWENLNVQYIQCAIPRDREKNELKTFREKYDALPYANHRG